MSGVLVSIIGILLCSAMLAVVLRSQRPELALCLGLAAGALVILLLLQQVTPLLATIRNLVQTAKFSPVYLTVLLKAAGVTLLTQLTADTCRDAGETALAGKAELAGRILMLLLAVPLFEEILSLVTALVNGQVVTS